MIQKFLQSLQKNKLLKNLDINEDTDLQNIMSDIEGFQSYKMFFQYEDRNFFSTISGFSNRVSYQITLPFVFGIKNMETDFYRVANKFNGTVSTSKVIIDFIDTTEQKIYVLFRIEFSINENTSDLVDIFFLNLIIIRDTPGFFEYILNH